MKRKILKKIICCLFISPILISILFLTSCTPELGKYDKEDGDGFKDFYDDIDDIVGIYEGNSEFEEASYDLEKSITNDYIMEYLKCEKDENEVAFKKYVYIVIPFKSNLEVESIVLYVKTTAETTDSARMNIEASAFYFKDSSSCPNKGDLKKMSDSDTETYADPAKEARVASSSTNVSKTFDSDYCFVFEGFHQTLDIGESYVKNGNLVVKKNSYLYLRIENNSALNRDMTPLDISFINLLVRAV